MKLLNKFYRKLSDEKLAIKIKRSEHWIILETLCDIVIALFIISMDFIQFSSQKNMHIYILLISAIILVLLLIPLFIVFDGRAAKKQLKENKLKKIKRSNLKDYIILEDKEVIQKIINQCVDSVLIENVAGSNTRVLNFYLNNEEVVTKVIEKDKDLWKSIDLK